MILNAMIIVLKILQYSLKKARKSFRYSLRPHKYMNLSFTFATIRTLFGFLFRFASFRHFFRFFSRQNETILEIIQLFYIFVCLKQQNMSTIGQRRKHILDHIRKDGFVKVSELAEALGVTQTTIRKDLRFLEAQGVLQRAHGSAIPPSQQMVDINLSAKKLINFEAKQKIAAKAASLIEADDSILIASGSTITLFAEALKPKVRLNVVSISVNISAQLGDIPGISVMQVGGILYGNTLSVLGAEASNTIENLFCSKVFFGVDGIDLDYGLTCGTGEEASITKKMMQSSQTSIVLSDSSKIGQRGFARICEVEDIDILITDSGISEEARQRIEKLGVNLIIVDL